MHNINKDINIGSEINFCFPEMNVNNYECSRPKIKKIIIIILATLNIEVLGQIILKFTALQNKLKNSSS